MIQAVKKSVVFLIDIFLNIFQYFLYEILLVFSYIPKVCVKSFMSRCGIEINGKQPWDIQVNDARFFARVAAYQNLGLFESYVDGWWDCDQLDVLLTKMFRSDTTELIFKYGGYLNYLRWNWVNRQTIKGSLEVINGHYDLGQDIFVATLDSTMNYCCGYWKKASNAKEASLDQMELIGKKLNLKPGMRLLDVGIGYGELDKYLCEKFKVSIVGYTLSKVMATEARRRCVGLPVKIIEDDYRNIVGKFDRIISIEMLEHVGPSNYSEFFQIMRECLKDDGLFLLHCCGVNNKNIPSSDNFFCQFVFKNVYVPRLEELLGDTNGLFVVEDLHNFGNYDKTLIANLEKFKMNWNDISKKYGAGFCRLWKIYLCTGAATHRSRIHQTYQIIFSKKGLIGGYESIR